MQRYYSNIYWHFTGSPSGLNWHHVTKPSDILKYGSPKSTEESMSILHNILESSTLLATCCERIYGSLVTDHFCCVTDIPLKDLLGHRKYYGDVAIGFKPGAIQPAFLPVMYIPADNLPMMEQMEVANQMAAKTGYDFLGGQGSWAELQGERLLRQAHAKVKQIDVEQFHGFLRNYLKITDFSTSEEDSFYREREWRHIDDFHFDKKDIAAIVVPKSFIPAISSSLKELDCPDDISLISWDVIELG